MYRVCISLIDATRARLLTLERVGDGMELHDELVEQAEVMRAQGDTPGAETPAAAGRATSRTGPFGYPSDDHRDHSVPQLDATFARTVLAMLRELIDERPTWRVVICAAPRILEMLRKCAPGILPDDVRPDELPYDLVELSLDEIRAKLTADGISPH